MPDFPIIDSHVHLWDPQELRLPWLDGNTTLNRPFTLTDYVEQTAGIAVEAMVYLEVDVKPAYGLLEAEWVLERTAEDPRLAAIVAWAPVEDGAVVRRYLRALTRLDPRIKGVRRLVQGEPDPAFSAQPTFVRGVQEVGACGLSFDLGLTYRQLPAAIALVRQCPDTTFILDHIGKPDIKGRQLDPWRAQIRELATFDNVVCKVSGMVTEADPAQWTPDDLAPYVAHVLESFGPRRVLYGGDWPVVLLASSYRRWYDALDHLTATLSDEARHLLWAENARRVYRLPASRAATETATANRTV